MEYGFWLILGFTSFVIISTTANDQYISEGAQIFNTIFHKYSTKVPPRKDFPQPVLLGINVNVFHVHSVNSETQIMTSTFDLEVSWQDRRLSWYPKSVQEIVIPLSEVWSPDLTVSNAVGKVEDLTSSKVVLKATGEIRWRRRLRAETFCPMNSSWALCTIEIGSDLLKDEVLSFNKNTSKCSEQVATAANHLTLEGGSMDISLSESMDEANMTYARYGCSVNVTMDDEYRAQPSMAYAMESSKAEGLRTGLWTLVAPIALWAYLFAQK